MSETKENSDKSGAGGVRKPAAAPRRPESSGHVQQNFSKGKTNTVVVEVVRKRPKFSASGAPVPAEKPKAPPAGQQSGSLRSGSGSSSGKPGGVRGFSQATAKGLSTGELDKRAQAVLVERKRAEEEAQRRAIEAAERQRVEDERLRLEAEERRLAEAEGRTPPPPATPPAAVEAAAPAEQAAAQSPGTATSSATAARPSSGPSSTTPAARPRDDQSRPGSARPPFRSGSPPSRPGAPAPVALRESEVPAKGGVVVPPRRARPDDKTLIEEEDSGKRKGGPGGVKAPARTIKPEERRNSTRLTVDKLLNDEQRERSMASLRRKREREARQRMGVQQSREKIVREVIIPEVITIQELAIRMSEKAVDVIRLLMKQGAMHKINDVLDADTAELLVTEFGHKVKRVSEADVEEGFIGAKVADEHLETRAPVVTIMGHVDHGKTSLLDAIRKANVAGGEAGGITQHIGAYQVATSDGQKITFIDTPGHEAFTAMRARGAKVTDIVVLVVAADDGVMPQTIEAIAHAKAAGVPMIVAINKIDKPSADPKRVATELLQHGVVVESMSGETLDIPVSAIKGTNLDKLLEGIALQSELLELKANPLRSADGFVIEAKLERGRGPVGTLLVQRGTLRVGDIIVAGSSSGRVRALLDDKGKPVASAGPSVPVEVLGFDSAPEAGDQFAVVESEARAREITDYRVRKRREALGSASSSRTLEQMMQQLKDVGKKEFPLVIKGDVQGSVEAIMGALGKLGNDEVSARIIHSGVGQITESDISLASASKAIILGFNVRANVQAKQAADAQGIEIRYYSIIYDLVDEVKAAMSGLLAPTKKEVFLGYATIKQVFNVSKVGKVAGCQVTDGKVERGAKVRLLRDKTVIHEGALAILKRFKDDVREVPAGQECGMSFANYQDIREGDEIECFQVEIIARTL